MKRAGRFAFSLVEIVVALGILVFALSAIVSLLPVGIQANRASSDNAEAANILTALEADLRNTYPSASFNFAAGRSQLFNLTLPYVVAAGRMSLDYSLAKTSLNAPLTSAASGGLSSGLDDQWNVTAISAAPVPRFQVSVIYTSVPSAGSLAPVEARLVVNWPALSGSAGTVADLTDPSKVRGFIQSYVTFKAP